MPFSLTANETAARAAAAAILEDVLALKNQFELAEARRVTIAEKIKALTDDQLAAFANEIGQDHFDYLSGAFGELRGYIGNSIMDMANILNNAAADTWSLASYAPGDPETIVTELAEQGRELVLVDGVYTVQPIP